MELHILGPVRLRTHEQIDVGATKVRGLLGCLSLRANEFVHVDRIAEALWDGDAPPDTGKVLQTYVSRLRRVFRDAGCPAELTHEHRAYRLDIDMSTVDFHRFVTTVRDGNRARGAGDLEAAEALYAAALALWAGPPLADLDTYWARRTRETLINRDLIPAQCALFDTRLALGDHDSVLSGLPALLSDHPNDERLASRWVRALKAANRADEVPVFFREFTQRLLDDLDARPPEELVRAVRDATSRHPAPARRPSPPRDTRDFTGRDDLLRQLDTLLAADDRVVDVVALDGPPGIGKTELVKHWARRQLDRFPGGVLYVDLAGYSDTPLVEPHAVMATFLAELGVNPTRIPGTTTERATLLRHLLSTRTVLVFLDNVRDSSHVRPLLEATSPCPALITSRQRLTGITYRDGVQPISVPALPADEATALLAKRIGTRASDDPAAFARLVELCRGLPLALRVVGEHVAMRPAVPIDELADELRNTKRLLDAGSHGDDHTTTLRSAFSLSYRALRAEEQHLFRLLGLHPGTRFSVRAVSALAGTPDGVERLLDSLVGAHLVAPEGGGRYHLHDLLHVYASDTAREDEPAEHRARAARRLFDWYLGSACHARAFLVGDGRDVPELAPEEPVDPMDFTSGDEALHWFTMERAILVACVYRAAELGYHEHVWRFSAHLHVLNRLGDPRDLLDVHEVGARSAEQAGRSDALGGCLNNKGYIHVRLGEDANASRCFERAHEAFTAAGDKHGVAVAMHNVGGLKLNIGELTEAITWLRTALAMNIRLRNEWAIANGHRSLGDASHLLGHRTEAWSHYRQSLYASQKNNDFAGQAATLARLAQLSLDENLLEEAVTYSEAALDMFDRVRVNRDGAASALCVLATAHLRRSAFPAAVSMAGEAVRTYQETDNTDGQIDGLILLGRIQASSGEPVEAAGTLTMAAELITSTNDPRLDAIRDLLAIERPVPAPRTEGSMGSFVDEVPEDVG